MDLWQPKNALINEKPYIEKEISLNYDFLPK